MTTVSSTTTTARPIHGDSAYADAPATDSVRKISSGAYATDDIASDANTGSAIRLDSRLCASRSLRWGRPTRMRFSATRNEGTAEA